MTMESHPRRAFQISRRGAIAGAAAAVTLAGITPSIPAFASASAVSADWAATDQAVAQVAPYHALLAAEVIDGKPRTIHALSPDLVLPVGSSFKFYVLGELARQVELKRVDWEQLIPIRDSQKSVPGGDLRYVPDGSTFTVRYLAERMIQKSDNTATDVLIDLLGRENVERYFPIMGHHKPSLNVPLFKTREFAFMKLVVSPSELDRFYSLDVAGRRKFLATVVPGLSYDDLIVAADKQTAPIDIMRTEWLASRADLVNAIVHLWTQSRNPRLRAVSEILSLETQLQFDAELWPYVGFKGGSEMGVLSGTWLMQRNDRRLFAYSVGFANPDAELDLDKVIAALKQGVAALAVS